MNYREGTLREKKSRKVHTCDECKQDIEKGTVYIRNSVQINGVYSSMARHKDCVDAAKFLRRGLETSSGLCLFMIPGLKKRPRVWTENRVSIKKLFPEVYDRLIREGLE